MQSGEGTRCLPKWRRGGSLQPAEWLATDGIDGRMFSPQLAAASDLLGRRGVDHIVVVGSGLLVRTIGRAWESSSLRCLWTVHLCTGTPSQSIAIALSSPAAPSTMRNWGRQRLRATRSSRTRCGASTGCPDRDRGRLDGEATADDRPVKDHPHNRLAGKRAVFQASQSPLTLGRARLRRSQRLGASENAKGKLARKCTSRRLPTLRGSIDDCRFSYDVTVEVIADECTRRDIRVDL